MKLLYSNYNRAADHLEREAERAVDDTAIRVREAIQTEVERQGLIDTRRYINGWRVVAGSHRYERLVVNDVEYGPRLLYGFIGKDILGRLYNQPARPHVVAPTEEQAGYLQQRLAAALVY